MIRNTGVRQTRYIGMSKRICKHRLCHSDQYLPLIKWLSDVPFAETQTSQLLHSLQLRRFANRIQLCIRESIVQATINYPIVVIFLVICYWSKQCACLSQTPTTSYQWQADVPISHPKHHVML